MVMVALCSGLVYLSIRTHTGPTPSGQCVCCRRVAVGKHSLVVHSSCYFVNKSVPP